MTDSNYLEVYRSRAAYLGKTPQERALSSGILEFRRYLHYNQHTKTLTSLIRKNQEQKIDVRCVILTDKQDENRASEILLTELQDTFEIGDLVKWEDAYWIIYKQTTSSYQPYNKYYAVKCNYLLKWVDSGKILHQSWCHIVGSEDSKIKDNFRTWHSLITPQPNKFIEIIMPYHYWEKTTEILLRDEAWYLVDYDKVSVEGLIYLSFTESKVNELRDSNELEIANYDRLKEVTIDGDDVIHVRANELFYPKYTIYLNGKIIENPQIIFKYSRNLLYDGLQFQAPLSGSAEIIACYSNATFTSKIVVDDELDVRITLVGDNKIKTTKVYEYYIDVVGADFDPTLIDPSQCSITAPDGGETKLATYKYDSEKNKFILTANNKNNMGTFEFNVCYDGEIYTKEIEVVALWQVI